MSDDDIDIDELKRQTSHGDRLDSDADNDQQQELAAAILDELDRIDADEVQKTISVGTARLPRTSALSMSIPTSAPRSERRFVANSTSTMMAISTGANSSAMRSG